MIDDAKLHPQYDEEEDAKLNTVLRASFPSDFSQLQASYAASSPHKLGSLSFSNVLLLPQQTNKQRKRDPNPAPLLQNCYGYSKPGQILTVLGPSQLVQGSLLHVLTGRRQALRNLRTGDFVCNDAEELFPVSRAVLVPSTPQHLKTSTVFEELSFACALRTPGNPSLDKQRALVQELMTTFHLEAKRNTWIKLLNPAELKRVAICVELLSLPNLLLVDQPIAGVDRKQDWETVCILKNIAKLQLCQVVVAVHAPRPEIFRELEGNLVLLSARGETLCAGTGEECIQLLASRGRKNTGNLAPGDFLLLAAEYSKETWPVAIVEQSGAVAKQAITPAPIPTPLQPLGFQLKLLFTRELRYSWVERNWIIFRFLFVGIIMAIVALFFMDQANMYSPKYSFGAHFGSFVFPILFLSIYSAVPTAIVMFGYKQVMLREQTQGSYSVLAALFVKTITEFVLAALLIIMSMCIMYWAVGWRANFGLFVIMFFALVVSCNSYGVFFALTSQTLGKTVFMTIIALGPQLLLLGAAARFENMPVWMSWLGYVCNMTWSMKLLVAVEMDDAYCIDPMMCATWKALKESDWIYTPDAWHYAVIIVAFFLFYRMWAFYSFHKQVARVK